MQKIILVALLVLGCTWTLQGIPVLPEPLYTTQENFDLTRFLGTWYDVAVASNCPHMKTHGREAAIGKLVLQSGTTADKVKATRTVLRHGTCKEMSVDYELTSTPGRFFYHITRWRKDVDAYVVHTNYNEYAIVMNSKQKSTGDQSTDIKLYSRTKTVRTTVLDDFKTLVSEQGMAEDTISIRQDKGDCVPGEVVAVSEPAQPEPQRVKRSVLLSSPAEEEGSGSELPLFNGTEACKAAPDSGPCFGMVNRFFYNSTSMSCQVFRFGGCVGNQNNFDNERECLQRCRTEAVCRLPMVAQPCKGQPLIWAFDSNAGLCVPYKAGFCQANGNKFYSKAECEEYCGVGNNEPELLQD
ncbi:uncharacterized protein V6R79_023754 [Siganus canaliculatus]